MIERLGVKESAGKQDDSQRHSCVLQCSATEYSKPRVCGKENPLIGCENNVIRPQVVSQILFAGAHRLVR